MLRKVLFRRKPWVALAIGAATLVVSATPGSASAASGKAAASTPIQGAVPATTSAPVSLSGWNLVIPVDSSGGTSGDATTISPATTHPPYLTQDSGGLHFWAPSNGALLGISLHARTELRGPGTFVLGQSPAGLLETTAVTQVPDNSHDIIIGQMFPTGTTPFAMLHYQSGKVYGFVHGQSSQYVLMTGIPLGATFQDSITAVGDTVTFSVTYNGQTVSQNVVGDSSWVGDTMHFQAGDYQQDLQNNPSTDGGAVTFSALCQYGVPGGAATAAGCAANDFSVAASPSSGSVTAGSTATATVSTAVMSGLAESVALSASGLPAGATASFSPASVTSGASSTLTIATTSSTPAGTYDVTVTGTAASGSQSTTYSLTVTAPSVCTPAQLLVNPGFESGDTGWTTSSTLGLDPITSDSGEPAHSGSYKAWFDGNGTADTDTLEQTVTIPAGCTATLTYWQHIDTTENTTTAKPDTLKVQVLTSAGAYLATLATYSNLDSNTGYAQKTFDLSAYAGQSIKVKWIGAETDANGGTTDFVIDDTGLTTS